MCQRHSATQAFCGAAHDGQAKPCAGRLFTAAAAPEALEGGVSLFDRNPGPVVLNAQAKSTLNSSKADFDTPSARYIAQRVVDKIDQH